MEVPDACNCVPSGAVFRRLYGNSDRRERLRRNNSDYIRICAVDLNFSRFVPFFGAELPQNKQNLRIFSAGDTRRHRPHNLRATYKRTFQNNYHNRIISGKLSILRI